MSLINKFKTNLVLIESLSKQSLRYYRFGNRVRNKGFYYSPTFESNKLFMKKDFDITDNKLSSEELRQKRNKLFDNEKKRQSELVSRVEKITVSVIDPYNREPKENITLLMNKCMSTPYDCSKHIHQMISERSVLALIDDKTFWDIHRPLVNDCTLRFKHFKEQNPLFVNKTFWRSCSLLMGSVIERAFKENINVYLYSWPKPDLNSGSFVYDVAIDLNDWKPNAEELRVFTAMLQKMTSEDIPFERLDVSKDLAKEMFEHNSVKREQIDSISASSNSDEVTIYRIKDHIDISCGPMIANTSQIGSIYMTAVHPMNTRLGLIYRFQGIAIPRQLQINSYILGILRERAQKLNTSPFLGNNSKSNVRQLSESNENKVNESVN